MGFDPSLSQSQILTRLPTVRSQKAILFPSGEKAGLLPVRVEEMSWNGTPGLRSGPCKSTRQMLVSVLSTAYARRFPSREMAGARALSCAKGSLRGFAGLRRRHPPEAMVNG